MRLRPEIVALHIRKSFLRGHNIRGHGRTISFILIIAASPPYLIDHVYSVALPQEILRPALTAVRRSRKIRSGLASSMNHNDGVRKFLVNGNLKFGVNLPDHHLGALA